ncbi:MAG: alpha/beta hydrolase-fold protein [Planctomycetota bacterium]
MVDEVIQGEGRRLDWVTLPFSRLGVLRRFGLYLPAGYGLAPRRYPVLYLFRGHETEWVGDQDGRPGLTAILDRAIATGRIDPLVVVLPGFMDRSRMHQGVPVDWSADAEEAGLGNGRLSAHFFEIKSWVEENLRVRVGPRSTGLDGFSMGGYSAVLLGTRHPEHFGSVGAYDGSFMWPGQIDPRRGPAGRADRLWFSETCAPYFSRDGRWDRAKMERHNPITLIETARGRRFAALKRSVFHVRAAGTERVGNLDRTRALVDALESRGIELSFEGSQLVLARRARHTWYWADRHLEGTLQLHDEIFRRDEIRGWTGVF